MMNSSTMNKSQSFKGDGSFWIHFQTAEIIINSILVPIIILTNLLIILVVKRMKNGRRPTDILVANLAASDILVGAVVLPLNIWRHLETFLTGRLTSDIFFCYFEFSVYLQPLCWSIQNMFLVALECLVSIIKPLWHRVHVNNVLAIRVAIVSWILGTIYFILPYCLLPLGLKKQACTRAKTLNTTFITIYPNAIFIITIMLHIVIIIYSKLATRESTIGARRVVRSDVIIKRHLKHLTFVLFVLCWAPVSFGVLIKEFGENTKLANIILRILLTVAHFNSFLNCIVYIFKSQRFRQEVRKVLRLRRNQVGVENLERRY